MSVRKNSAALRVVKASDEEFGCVELLVVGRGETRRVRIEERDISVPQLDLLLHDQFTVHGLTKEEGPAGYGGYIHVSLSVLWRGAPRTIKGYALAMLNGPDVALPRGTLSEWQARAA